MKSKKFGFTLIELLVVITIIGILAVGGIVVYTEQIKKARDSNRVIDINTLNLGMKQYELDTGKYYEVDGEKTADDESLHIAEIPLFRDALRIYVSNVQLSQVV